MDVGELVVRLKADLKNFTANMTVATTKVKSFGAAATLGMAKAAGAVKAFAVSAISSLTGVVTSLKSYVRWLKWATAIAGVYVIKVGADAEESENLFTVAFENMADSVRAWSETLAAKLKISATGLRSNAANLQLFLTGMQLTTEEASKLSTALSEQILNITSLRNIQGGYAEGLRKVQAALSGEVEPLRRLGITVNETTIRLWAQTHGLDANVSGWTEQQKVLARAGVIFDRTQKDMGDLERTSGSVTNLLRSLKDQIVEVGIAIYQKWLPHITAAIAGMRDWLIANRELIAQIAGKILDTIVGIGKRLRDDFPGTMRVGLDIAIELLKGFGDSVVVIMKHAGSAAAEAFKQSFAGTLAQWMADIARPDGVFGWMMSVSPAVTAARLGAGKAAIALKEMSLAPPKTGGPTIAEDLAKVTAEVKKNVQGIIEKQPQVIEQQNKTTEAFAETNSEASKMVDTGKTIVDMFKKVTEQSQTLSVKWKQMWAEASAGIAGSMKTAFADIMENANNATQALSNMFRQIGRAISEAVFQQYLLGPIFGGINALGIPLRVPAQQATVVEAGQYQKPSYHQYGGFFPKNTDTVPAMISPGEAVLPERMVDVLRKGLGVEGPATSGSTVNINVNAIDSQNTMQFFSKNKRMIAGMLERTMDANHSIRRR